MYSAALCAESRATNMIEKLVKCQDFPNHLETRNNEEIEESSPFHALYSHIQNYNSQQGERSKYLVKPFISFILHNPKAMVIYSPQLAQTLFLMGLDPGAERSLRLSILFAEAAKFYSSNTIELVAATPI